MPISDASSVNRICRPAVIAAVLALAGCGSPQNANPFDVPDADRIECAIGAGAAFARDCVVEQTVGADGLVLTVRHADGGFRRLLVTKDGRGVTTADGADAATVAVAGNDGILVTVGDDRYRLPATVKRAK